MLIEEKYVEEHRKLSKKLRYSATSQMILALTTAFIIKDVPFDEQRYDELKAEIKKQTSLFSGLRMSSYIILMPHLLEKDNIASAVEQLLVNYDLLLSQKFSRMDYTYVAALYVQDEAHAERAKQYYDALKKYHKFLTSYDDVPYAVLLTKDTKNIDAQVAAVAYYYNELAHKGLKKGNYLLWLAQLLTIKHTDYDARLVDAVLHVIEELRSKGIKKQEKHYVIYGTLALAEMTTEQLDVIIDLAKQLGALKPFKWYKDDAFFAAVQIATSMKAKSLDDTTYITFVTALQALIHMQQAAATTVISTTHS